MKKHYDPAPPVVGKASLESMIGHVVEVIQTASIRKQTKAQKQAAEILARCLANRYEEEHPTPFGGDAGKSSTAVDPAQLWLSGDLAIGRGGPEFVYVYSPTALVEELIAEALKLTTAPIKASSRGQGIEGKISRQGAHALAETFTTAGTIYLLNNLRDKLNEAIEDLFVEARTVLEELQRATLESGLSELVGIDKDAAQIGRARFTRIIKAIIDEGNSRRRARLRQALWEIARGRGRPKGTRGSATSQRFGKTEFFAQLKRKIKDLSRVSEAEFTRQDVANALGLSNAKTLDRLRRQFGDQRRWRECVAQIIAGE